MPGGSSLYVCNAGVSARGNLKKVVINNVVITCGVKGVERVGKGWRFGKKNIY
jgi:hypothetical protein